MNKARAISVRLDDDLESPVERWLEQNPGFTLSRLTNLALRQFISRPQTLQSILLTPAQSKTRAKNKKPVHKSIKKR